MNTINRLNYVAMPKDLSIEAKCLLFNILNNFARIHTETILYPREPYASRLKKFIDDYPKELGITYEIYRNTLFSIVGNSDYHLTKLLSSRTNPIQKQYCKYVITEMALLIWRSGNESPSLEKEISNSLEKNIFIYL